MFSDNTTELIRQGTEMEKQSNSTIIKRTSDGGSVEFVKMGTQIKQMDTTNSEEVKRVVPVAEIEERVVDLGSEESFVFSEATKKPEPKIEL